MIQSADRYVIRPNPNAPGLWDVWDTLRDEPVSARKLCYSRKRVNSQQTLIAFTANGGSSGK